MEEKEIRILFHHIVYHYDNGIEMPECEQEHVKKMINDGCNQGELCYLSPEDEEIRGWWRIDCDKK